MLKQTSDRFNSADAYSTNGKYPGTEAAPPPTRWRHRLCAYDRYLAILGEGTEPL